jgi:hypothetical protein
MRKLTAVQKRDLRAIAAKKDRDIDFSDAPAVLDWKNMKNMGQTNMKNMGQTGRFPVPET